MNTSTIYLDSSKLYIFTSLRGDTFLKSSIKKDNRAIVCIYTYIHVCSELPYRLQEDWKIIYSCSLIYREDSSQHRQSELPTFSELETHPSLGTSYVSNTITPCLGDWGSLHLEVIEVPLAIYKIMNTFSFPRNKQNQGWYDKTIK